MLTRCVGTCLSCRPLFCFWHPDLGFEFDILYRQLRAGTLHTVRDRLSAGFQCSWLVTQPEPRICWKFTLLHIATVLFFRPSFQCYDVAVPCWWLGWGKKKHLVSVSHLAQFHHYLLYELIMKIRSETHHLIVLWHVLLKFEHISGWPTLTAYNLFWRLGCWSAAK